MAQPGKNISVNNYQRGWRQMRDELELKRLSPPLYLWWVDLSDLISLY